MVPSRFMLRGDMEYKKILRKKIEEKRKRKAIAGYPISDTFDIPQITGPKWQFLDMWYNEISRKKAYELFDKGVEIFGIDNSGDDYLILDRKDIDKYDWFGVSKKVTASQPAITKDMWYQMWQYHLEESIEEIYDSVKEEISYMATEEDLSREQYQEFIDNAEKARNKLMEAIKYENIYRSV